MGSIDTLEVERIINDTDAVIRSSIDLRNQLAAILDRASEAAPEEISGHGKGETSPDVARLFQAPWPHEGKQRLKAYEPFFPGAQIGFDADCSPIIEGEQRPATEPGRPAGRHYEFVIDVVDHAETNWISFEVLTNAPAVGPPAFWTVSGRLASSNPGPISAFVFAPQQDGDFHRVEIGAGETGAEPRSFLFSGLVDLTSFDDIRQDGRLRLILFLPTGANARMVLSHLDLFISERPDEKEN